MFRDDARRRIRQLGVLAGGLLVLVRGAVLRSTLRPPPLAVALAGLSGSTLDGDSFVRGTLDLSLHDSQGRARQVRLDVPAEASLQRLLRYPCR